MERDPWDWEETDLDALIGQQESARLEFKSKDILKDRQQVANRLTPAVSAFANSEGGTIVIGVREEKQGKKGARFAVAVDGVADELVSSEWLQQLIEGNLRPYLPGIRLRKVRLGNGPTAAFVIYVPRGSTAYQASDLRYYGRSEFEVKPLLDHDIRLRMLQGRTPRAKMAVWMAKPVDPEQQHTDLSEYAVSLSLENTGELTIRDFLLAARPSCRKGFEMFFEHRDDKHFSYRLRDGVYVSNAGITTYLPEEKKVFPGSSHPVGTCHLAVPHGKTLAAGRFKLTYSVYLDDILPITEEIDLGRECEQWLKKYGPEQAPSAG